MKNINLGASDFKEIIDNKNYFIDKTLIVKEFLEDTGKIVLLPRPRRFGKTLNLSIIKYFLEKSNENVSNQDLEVSLFRLSKLLNDHYNQKVIILIDEYDTPIHSGHFEGYYSEMMGFMRNFLSEALKDNKNLEKAMLTGILRVAKESIFSGLNNLKVYTLLESIMLLYLVC